jgi:toxin-antitoxin system PIN domain toxin
MKSYFPDVNVWVALAYEAHQHHAVAVNWLGQLDAEAVYFCRLTQLGLLRLLTHASVMGDEVISQSRAWEIYDGFLQDPRISFHTETDPEEIQSIFRRLTSGRRSLPQQWPDAYLLAYARVAELMLVTFDRGLHRMAPGGVVLLS